MPQNKHGSQPAKDRSQLPDKIEELDTRGEPDKLHGDEKEEAPREQGREEKIGDFKKQ